MQLRDELGEKWLEFKSRHDDASGIDTSDKDPQEYVEEHSGGTPKDSDRAGDAPEQSLQASETEG